MDGHEQEALDAAMTALASKIVADERLEAELHRARREFLGAVGDGAAPEIGPAAQRRFFEWFALERESDVLGDVPVAIPNYEPTEDLAGSVAGAYSVTGVAPQYATARDLQDGSMLEFVVPPESLAVGDLVVGRIFAVGAGQWLPSSAASVFRPGGSLAEAFARDVGKLELGRRLLQIELEHVLLRPQEQAAAAAKAAVDAAAKTVADDVGAPLEHLEADLDRLLQGMAKEYSATAISEQLAASARPGVVIAPLLEEIAFETNADLDAVRRVLLEMWNAQHKDDEPAAEAPDSGPPGETLGERMVRTLDDGLRSHREIEGLFAELENMAGLEPGAADDDKNPFDEDDGDNPVTGNLVPLVEEYLWEAGLGDSDAATTLRTWLELQGNAAVPHIDLDQVTGVDLMRLLLHIYLSAAPKHRADAVQTAFGTLREFYAWAERTQQLDLSAPLAACRGPLLDQLDRLAVAGLGLSTPATGGRPALFEIEQVAAASFGMRDDNGDGHWLDVPAGVAERLTVGDLVLGALTDGPAFIGPVVVLPAEARELME